MGAFDDLIPAGAGVAKGGGGAREGQAIRSAAFGAQDVEAQLARVEQLYRENFTKPDLMSQVMEFVPFTPQRRQLDKAIDLLRPLLKGAVRAPGEGAFTDADQALLDRSLPSGSDYDGANWEAITGARGIIDRRLRRAGMPVPTRNDLPFGAAPPAAPRGMIGGGRPAATPPAAARPAAPAKRLRFNPATGDFE